MNPSKELEQHPEGKQDQDVTMRVCGCGSVCGVGGVRVMGCEWVVRVVSGWMCLWMGECVFGAGAYVWLCVSGCVSECVSVCVCACWQGRQEHSWESEEIHWKQRKKKGEMITLSDVSQTKTTSYDITSMWNLKTGYKWTYLTTEIDSQTQKTNLAMRSCYTAQGTCDEIWWRIMWEKECVCVSHFAVQQRLREHCKSTKINSLKFKKKEWLNKRWDSVKKRKTNMFTKGEVGEG